MKIKALKSFTTADLSISLGKGWVAEIDDTVATDLITDGFVEEYKMLTPTGTISVTENGTVDVAQYETAAINVGIYTVSYDVNGGTGSISDETVIAGNTVALNSGSTLTPPTDKVFSGWATTSDATAADVTSPYKPTGNVTLYAVWVDGV
jgi:uncharacterized repeat protein (TIGR02543 family)